MLLKQQLVIQQVVVVVAVVPADPARGGRHDVRPGAHRDLGRRGANEAVARGAFQLAEPAVLATPVLIGHGEPDRRRGVCLDMHHRAENLHPDEDPGSHPVDPALDLDVAVRQPQRLPEALGNAGLEGVRVKRDAYPPVLELLVVLVEAAGPVYIEQDCPVFRPYVQADAPAAARHRVGRAGTGLGPHHVVGFRNPGRHSGTPVLSGTGTSAMSRTEACLAPAGIQTWHGFQLRPSALDAAPYRPSVKWSKIRIHSPFAAEETGSFRQRRAHRPGRLAERAAGALERGDQDVLVVRSGVVGTPLILEGHQEPPVVAGDRGVDHGVAGVEEQRGRRIAGEIPGRAVPDPVVLADVLPVPALSRGVRLHHRGPDEVILRRHRVEEELRRPGVVRAGDVGHDRDERLRRPGAQVG